MKGDIIKYASFYDATLNDSNKTLADYIPEIGTYDWQLLYAHASFTTTAIAGNRHLEFEVTDPDGNSIIDIHSGSNQAASLTYHYMFLQGVYRETVSAIAPAGVDGTIQVPFPVNFVIPAGHSLVLKDANAIDAAADDLTVSGMVAILR